MPGHRRPKDGVLSHTYVSGMHAFSLASCEQDVGGIGSRERVPQVAVYRLAVTNPAMTS